MSNLSESDPRVAALQEVVKNTPRIFSVHELVDDGGEDAYIYQRRCAERNSRW